MGSRIMSHKRFNLWRAASGGSRTDPARGTMMHREGMTPRLELALRWSARWHDGQMRKGGDVPYFQHAAAVAIILDRAGFDEDVVIAGLLHDAVEDTAATFEDLAERFGPVV